MHRLILLLQKRAARLMLGLRYGDPVSHRFEELNIRTIHQLRDHRCMILIYKIRNNSAPQQINHLIEWLPETPHNHFTRNHNILAIPFSRTVKKQHTFRIYGSKLCNRINNLHTIRFDTPISSFKRQVAQMV